MDTKKLRYFLFGLIIGVAGAQWFSCCAGETVDTVLAWLQRTADTYRADHPSPNVDTGWGPRKKQQ